MEENQQNKQNNKGILIIIALVVVAVAVYFIVQGVSKKNKNGSQPTLSISEEDRLELSALNLHGKWNKTVGSDRYELNFKSDHELVLTQYDANGEVLVKSDEGTYSVENGVLNLTVIAGGTPSTASCNAVVSVENLVITTIEGSTLFAGAYTADMGDVPDFDTSDNTSSVPSTSTDNSNQSEPTQSSGNTSTSEPATSTPAEEYHLPAFINTVFSKTMLELPPSVDQGMINYISDGQYTVYPHYNDIFYPYEIYIDTDNLFPELESYTYNDLKKVLGDKLTFTVRYDELWESDIYTVEAVVDGYELQFCTILEHIQTIPIGSLEGDIKSCIITPIKQNTPIDPETPSATEEFHLPAIVSTLFSTTAEEYFNGNRPLADSTVFGSGVKTISDGTYSFEVYYDLFVDQSNGQAYSTGHPNNLYIETSSLFPELTSYNYYGLKSILGDKISYEVFDSELDGVQYDIRAYVDGFELYFGYMDGGLKSLDEEINNCFIYKGERM